MIDLSLALSILFFQVGSRNISFDLTEGQKVLMKHPITKLVIMLAMFYVSSRSLTLSLIAVILYYFILHVFLNEYHEYSVLHHLIPGEKSSK